MFKQSDRILINYLQNMSTVSNVNNFQQNTEIYFLVISLSTHIRLYQDPML